MSHAPWRAPGGPGVLSEVFAARSGQLERVVHSSNGRGKRGSTVTRWLFCVSMTVGLVACRTQRTEFCNEVFACDVHAAKDPCGKSCAGKPMTCVAGSQLGGTDFCADACDPAHGS